MRNGSLLECIKEGVVVWPIGQDMYSFIEGHPKNKVIPPTEPEPEIPEPPAVPKLIKTIELYSDGTYKEII